MGDRVPSTLHLLFDNAFLYDEMTIFSKHQRGMMTSHIDRYDTQYNGPLIAVLHQAD